MAEESGETESDQETGSVQSRHWLTNDIISGFLVALLFGLNVAYLWMTGDVPLWLAGLDSFAIGTAVVWTFGGGAASKAVEAIRGPGQ